MVHPVHIRGSKRNLVLRGTVSQFRPNFQIQRSSCTAQLPKYCPVTRAYENNSPVWESNLRPSHLQADHDSNCILILNFKFYHHIFYFFQMWLACLLACSAISVAFAANEYLPPSKGYTYNTPSISFPTPRVCIISKYIVEVSEF